jgi:hypothetical protein
MKGIDINEGRGGVGFVIRHVWAMLAVHSDGDEGVMAVRGPTGWMPLIAADKARLDEIVSMGRAMGMSEDQRMEPPWRWEPRVLDGEHWMILLDANGTQVIAVPVVDNTAAPSAITRLIAAAPELLEVATRAAGMRCLCAATYSDVTHAWDPAGDCAACAARALIRRIEGP